MILKKKKKVFKAVVIVLAAVGVFLAAGWLVHKVVVSISMNRAMDAAKPVAKAAKPVVNKKKTVAVTPNVAPKNEEPKASAPVAVDNTAQTSKRVFMTVRAQTSTWVSVQVDGDKVFQGLLKKGSSSTWRAVKRIELSAKDTAALEFEVNGKNVGKISRRDIKARKIVVTADGLDVAK